MYSIVPFSERQDALVLSNDDGDQTLVMRVPAGRYRNLRFEPDAPVRAVRKFLGGLVAEGQRPVRRQPISRLEEDRIVAFVKKLYS